MTYRPIPSEIFTLGGHILTNPGQLGPKTYSGTRPPSQLGPIPTRHGSTRPTFQLLIFRFVLSLLLLFTKHLLTVSKLAADRLFLSQLYQ
jgi:hypothetical protein